MPSESFVRAFNRILKRECERLTVPSSPAGIAAALNSKRTRGLRRRALLYSRSDGRSRTVIVVSNFAQIFCPMCSLFARPCLGAHVPNIVASERSFVSCGTAVNVIAIST